LLTYFLSFFLFVCHSYICCDPVLYAHIVNSSAYGASLSTPIYIMIRHTIWTVITSASEHFIVNDERNVKTPKINNNNPPRNSVSVNIIYLLPDNMMGFYPHHCLGCCGC